MIRRRWNGRSRTVFAAVIVLAATLVAVVNATTPAAGASPQAATPATPASSVAPVTPATAAAGAFVALNPRRVLDTRTAIGAPGPVAANASITVQITGSGGVPATRVSAVMLNVTVTEPTAAGWITVFPTGGFAPDASNLNFAAAQTVPNAVVARLSASGRLTLTNNSAGPAQLIADVSGFFRGGTPTEPGTFTALSPARVLDTRTGAGPVSPNATLPVQITGHGGVPATGVAAVALNLTVTAPEQAGWVTAYPDGTSVPDVSNLNFIAGQTVANLAVVPVSAGGRIALRNSSAGSSQLIADVAGYYLAGTPTALGAFVPITPTRVLDSRRGIGVPRGPFRDPITFTIAGLSGVPASEVAAVVMTVTVTEPRTAGWMTVIAAGGDDEPEVSTMNFAAGQTVPNLVVPSLSLDGTIQLLNFATGRIHLIADVSGYYIGERQLTWVGTEISPERGRVTDMSCVGAEFCALSDQFGFVTTGGTTWGLPARVASDLVSISCPAVGSCIALDAAGHVYRQSAGVWTGPSAPLGPGGSRVSCPTTSFCGALGYDWVATFDGTGWTVMAVGAPFLQALSCPTAGLCFATADWEPSWKYSGGAWSTMPGPGIDMFSLSCVSATFCMAAGANGAVPFDGTEWGPVVPIAEDDIVHVVSCASATFCMAIELDGGAYLFDGTFWGPRIPTPGGHAYASQVSCTSTSLCRVAFADGEVLTWSAGTWTAVPVDPANPLLAVSCASTTFCAAVGGAGEWELYDGTTWSAPYRTGSLRAVTDVSCPVAGFCMAVDEVGNAWVHNGTTIAGPQQVAAGVRLLSVSCASTTFCLAVDGLGTYYRYSGAGWSGALPVRSGLTLLSVSCVTSTFCLGVNERGVVAQFNGTVWSPSADLNLLGYASVSCLTTDFCLVVGPISGGSAAIPFSAGTWGTPMRTGTSGSTLDVDCASSTVCVEVGSFASLSVFNGARWITRHTAQATPVGVSCPSVDRCVMVSRNGVAYLGSR